MDEGIGREWLISEVDKWTETIERVKPSEFSEQHRYLPEFTTTLPGPMRFDVVPYMIEPLDCLALEHPCREINFKKGVQVTYTTSLLESAIFYFAAHIATLPMMYITADDELASLRVEGNIIPMLQQSGFGDIIESRDVGNKRKTGKTKKLLQFKGGAFLISQGAQNADKMRQTTVLALFKDEIDPWPDVKDGDSDALTDDRCSGYWDRRKILRGSTPLIKYLSKIDKAFERGDQRYYLVRCLSCGFPQKLRWNGTNKETGKEFGFKWELENGTLLLDSVRYSCANCHHDHSELDKEKLFALDYGAHWEPTAQPVEPNIRSYHLPAFYSPIGVQPWSKSVAMWLSAYDPVEKKVRDMGRLQTFYNNVLGESFEVKGAKIHFVAVSGHRRREYTLGQIPNAFAQNHTGGPVLMVTCQVDVHKSNLAVAVMGWTRDMRCFLIDYWRIPDDSENGCEDESSPAWARLEEIIDETVYVADDGRKYRITITLIDANYLNARTCEFASQYSSGVYPILGRDAPAKKQKIQEFAKFTTQIGTVGYRILVDHYKERLAPVLRREWSPDAGEQKAYHFNAPVDTSDKQLKELTREIRREKRNDLGIVSYEWHRPGNAPNELWDLLVYGSAAVEIVAWGICVEHFELESVDWKQFWDFAETNELYFDK